MLTSAPLGSLTRLRRWLGGQVKRTWPEDSQAVTQHGYTISPWSVHEVAARTAHSKGTGLHSGLSMQTLFAGGCCGDEVCSCPLGVPQRHNHPGELGLTYVTGWGFLGCTREKRDKKGKTLTTSPPCVPTSEISEKREAIWAEKFIPCYTHVLCSKYTKTSPKTSIPSQHRLFSAYHITLGMCPCALS